MPLEAGQPLLHYRLVEKLGQGGMGAVWRAFDTKLEREVALKILPEALSREPERLGRFEREAKIVASLDHPNIVTLHSVEESEGRHFLTMELVRGKSLGELIPRQGFLLERLFELVLPLVDAVAAAHDSGVTHRDLKPANIMVDDRGRLRVLDFGLAKTRAELARGPLTTQMPTVAVTEEGKILGTVAYMSPEQAEGKPFDHRSDIFSLGVVLYEMATGRRPFQGDTGASIISSILRDTPPSVTDLNRSLPRHLGRIVRRCLQKDPERRYQTTKDVFNDLVELKEEVDSGEIRPAAADTETPSRRRAWWAGYAVLLLVAVAAVVAMRFFPRGDAPEDDAGPNVTRAVQLTSIAGYETYPSISPDGKALVYVSTADGDADIYYQRVGGQTAINLTADCSDLDTQPAFSPDGERIVFRSGRDDGGVFLMGATGESVRRVADLGFDPSWAPDGRHVVVGTIRGHFRGRAFGSELWVVDVETGAKRRVDVGRRDAVQPSWSPSGHRIAFVSAAQGGSRKIFTAPAEGGASVPAVREAMSWSPVWSPDGRHLLFSSNRSGGWNLWRVPIDERSGEVRGPPEPITTGGGTERVLPSVSADGRLVAYCDGAGRSNIGRVALDPRTGTVRGSPQAITTGTIRHGFPSASPDDRWVSFTGPGEPEDVYVVGVDGSGRRRLTRGGRNRASRWSPDGSRVAFQSGRGGSAQIWAIRPDGTGLEQLTDYPDGHVVSPVWSPDGTKIAVSEAESLHGYTFDLGRPLHQRTLDPFPPMAEADLRFAPHCWSPDGSSMAGVATSWKSRDSSVVLYSTSDGSYRRLLEEGLPGGWLPDGRTLLFVERFAVHALDVETLERREIFSLSPPSYVTEIDVSTRGEWLYYIHSTSEADIWMLEIDR
jgi:Tol biopolymer transport system component